MSNDYYVYMYLRESDGTPYYVGKGKGDRYKKKHRVNIPPLEENIIFVNKELTNEAACFLEKELIYFYGRKDTGEGILQNQTDGGDGGDTSKSENYQKWLNEEARDKNSEYILSLSKRMKENNPLYNPEISKKCQTTESRLKRSKSLKGKNKSDEHKDKLRIASLNQSKEISLRQQKLWSEKVYKENVSKSMLSAVDKRKEMSLEEFYDWVSSKNIFSYSNGIKRPNGRVKCIIDHFGKTEEFYGEYFKEAENKKRNWEYYKECTEEEFEEWIKEQNLYRKDGNKNPRIYSVIKHRGLIEKYYSPEKLASGL